ncbi:MAG: hypothetical protein LBR35_01210 [Rickettsiales bacterium]|nr:hypothetical protein [Rickettsiales bacterium]
MAPQTKKQKEVNVICIKWGTRYPAVYANRLYNMIKRNTSFNIKFHCFTDNTTDLDKNIIIHPLPTMNMDMKDCKYAYRKEAGLCDDNLGGLKGQRVFYFDLDTIILGNLDELFAYPQDNKFYIQKDWAHSDGSVGQASLYSWVIGTLGYVKSNFEAKPQEIIKKYFTASQEYLSDMIIQKSGKLNFWPQTWVASFRFHCMPVGILRPFIAPTIPNWDGLKMITFHGIPNMQEAIIGQWGEKTDAKYPKGWKKIYKSVRPTLWVKYFWW